MIDVAEDLARLEHEAADVLVCLAFENEVLLELLLLLLLLLLRLTILLLIVIVRGC